MKKLDTVILAGGLGTRLRGVLGNLPKALALINGRPFLDIILRYLERSHCTDRVIIAVGYMGDKIMREYKKRRDFNFDIVFSKENKLLGTGGAIRKSLCLAKTENIIVLNGDTYIAVNLKDFIASHLKKRSYASVVLKQIKNPNRYGIVEIDKDKKVISFKEKKMRTSSGYINTGMYIFRRELFDTIRDIAADVPLSLERDLMPYFLEAGVYSYVVDGKFIDMGTPESYGASEQFFKCFVHEYQGD